LDGGHVDHDAVVGRRTQLPDVGVDDEVLDVDDGDGELRGKAAVESCPGDVQSIGR